MVEQEMWGEARPARAVSQKQKKGGKNDHCQQLAPGQDH